MMQHQGGQTARILAATPFMLGHGLCSVIKFLAVLLVKTGQQSMGGSFDTCLGSLSSCPAGPIASVALH
jgi:hypothetical protein